MKKFTVWFVILLMLFTSVTYAQEAEIEVAPATFVDASETFDKMIECLTSMISDDNEVDVTKVLSGCSVQLLELQLGFVSVADDGGDKDLFSESRPAIIEYSVAPVYIDDFGYVAGYNVYREDNYICIESEAFDADNGEQLDYLCFEIAQREDTGETMLLYTYHDIDGVTTSSNRYLVYKNADPAAQLLYSRTFGTTLEYRIDLNEWAKGTDYVWSKELLYPAN